MRLSTSFASLRRHGAWATLKTAFRRRRTGVRRIVLFGLMRPGDPPKLGAAHALSFRFASPEEAERLGEMSPEETPLALRSGDRCLLQFDADTLVGYTWVAVSPIVFLTEGLHLPLPSDAAYIYKTYTLPQYRGSGLQSLRTLELHRRLALDGRHRFLCYVADTNLQGLKGVRKVGYERVGEVTFRFEKSEVEADLRLARDWWSDVRRI